MKNLILIFSILLGFLTTKAQTFELLISSSKDEIALDAIELDDGTFVIGRSYGNYLQMSFQNALTQIDIAGNILKEVNLPDDDDYWNRYLLNIFRDNDCNLICFRYVMEKATGIKQFNLVIFNNNLEMIESIVYGDRETEEDVYGCLLTSDHKFITVGRKLYAIKELYLGEYCLNEKTYRYSTFKDFPSFAFSTVVEIPEKNSYHVFNYYDANNSFFEISKDDLDIVAIYNFPSQFKPRDAIRGFDDSHYFVGGVQQGGFDFKPCPAYIKVSSNGEILKHNFYSTHPDTRTYYSYNSIDHNQDHLFIGVTFNWREEMLFPYYPQQEWIQINKTDQDGNLLWQRFYKGEVSYFVTGVVATSDGGALILSQKYDWFDSSVDNLDLHILKVDSTGWYEGMPVNINDPDAPKQILVYPNPVYDHVTFELGMYRDLDLKVYNQKGQVVFERKLAHSQTIKLAALPSGIYFYVIESNEGFTERGKLLKR